MILPHKDAPVLTLGVGDFDMYRILIDPGSFTDFLQMSAYMQMGYSSSTLENSSCVLSEFNGTTTISLSDVVLFVQVGPTILNVCFFIMEDLSSYNAIME